MNERLNKLKELLLHKEIARANEDTLTLKDGTKVRFYMSNND